MDLKNSGDVDSHVIAYRPDIDGLRAIAVLSVIFYHLSMRALPGGYLGVDMFFVVSGFLITSIIWREAQNGHFSTVRFYERRIRRIMPALFMLLLVTTAIAALLLLPADLIGYGKSLLSTLAFVANVYFWRDTNYFSPAAEQKPLLHLWSLGVEEQFYIIFPLILVMLARHWPRGALPVIAGIALGSLALNILALVVGGDTPAFFLLPTRAWEFGFGAFPALLRPHIRFSSAASGVTAFIGAMLTLIDIIHPFALFEHLPAALPVTIGTALMILAGSGGLPLVNRALTFPPLVFIGLISYSLYLWHWPIIVFVKYYLVHELNIFEMLAALVCMTICASISWRFIERPFRSKAIPTARICYAALGGTVMLAITAALLISFRGLPQRLSPEAAAINAAVGSNYRCPVTDYVRVGLSRGCVMNLPSRNPTDADVVLLGNSHAQMYFPLWASVLAKHQMTGLLIPVNSCLPTVQANISRECSDTARSNLTELLKLSRVRIVVLGLTWWYGADGLVDSEGHVLDNQGDRALSAALDDLVAQLRSNGKKVILIGPIASPDWDVASIISRQLAFGHPIDRPTFLPKSDFMQLFGPALRHFEARSDIEFVRPDLVQCHNERCDYLRDGRSLFADNSHLAAAELPRFRPLFEAAFAAALPAR